MLFVESINSTKLFMYSHKESFNKLSNFLLNTIKVANILYYWLKKGEKLNKPCKLHHMTIFLKMKYFKVIV